MSRLINIASILVAIVCTLLSSNQDFISEARPIDSSLDQALSGLENIAQGGDIYDIGEQSSNEDTPGQPAQPSNNLPSGSNVTATSWVEYVASFYDPRRRRSSSASSNNSNFSRFDYVSDDVSFEDILELIADESDCPICTLNKNDAELIKLDCGHKFHRACLLDWYTSGQSNYNRCPTCRTHMSINSTPISSYLLRGEGTGLRDFF